MNNVLEDSLFVSQNKKFDEIQSIIKDNIFAVIQNYARKKLRGSGFAVQSMMMNMGVDFLKAGYDFCVRKYGTSTQDHLDAMSTLSKMYEHAYECFILGKHTARNGVAGISPPRREFQKC